MADRHLDIAREVLSANDRSRFTVPAAGQYPHQWNWDSALIASAWATIDPDRAWTELEALAGAQDPASELIAHIAFTPGAEGYEPGPASWWPDGVPAIRGVDGRQISQISQPPVAATCLRLLHERHPRPDRLPALIEVLHAWHRFWMTDRDPARSGEPVIIHPRESGRDNAAEFASALAPSHRSSSLPPAPIASTWTRGSALPTATTRGTCRSSSSAAACGSIRRRWPPPGRYGCRTRR
jgi:hypothetical protein